MIQKDTKLARLQQKTQSITMITLLVMVVLILQLWLITIALEGWLAASQHLAWPTFLASGGCLLLNLRLLKYVNDLDRREELD